MRCGEQQPSLVDPGNLDRLNRSNSASAPSSAIHLKAVAVAACTHGRPLSVVPIRGNEQSIDLILSGALAVASGLSGLAAPVRQQALVDASRSESSFALIAADVGCQLRGSNLVNPSVLPKVLDEIGVHFGRSHD